ncbi:uncharacterized protein LOC134804580 isoform X2 [Cydia splendana]|uniref:uncharacterized protein LOC134804580 isoform X2 n=1 Tax=Cydia splendana TaxID=1100963 RepID=UPI00300D94AC
MGYLAGQGSDANSAADATDGELYLKKLHNKENIASSPAYLLFTAPYRICEGGCNYGNDTNFAMAFPLFIGNYRERAYREIYPNDTRDPDETFRRTRSTRPPFTTCSPEKPTPYPNTKSTMYPGYRVSVANTQSTAYPGYTGYRESIADTQSTGYPGYRQSIADTQSTGYPGYREYRDTQSTGYPGYREYRDTQSTRYPGYDDYDFRSTVSTVFPRLLRKLTVRKSRARYYPDYESFRKTQGLYFSGNSNIAGNIIPGRYGLKMQRPKSSNIRRNVPMEHLKPVQIWWSQLMPGPRAYIKPENLNHAELKKIKRNELSPFGIMPVLPIT